MKKKKRPEGRIELLGFDTSTDLKSAHITRHAHQGINHL